MIATYYRIQDADRNPAALLDPTTWQSRAWVGHVDKECTECHGFGDILGDPVDHCDDGECGVCYGYPVPVPEKCQTCGGVGRVEDIRHGVSACRSLTDLAAYFANHEANLDGCVLVELAGERAADEDHDAAEGAVLIHPTAVLSVSPVPAEIAP